jgi:NAD+--asparagine ADP-ribosyltransferase
LEERRETNEVYSKRVKAGKRTYFFDVKATRANDYYLTITESRKKFKENGHCYEKHKIFLYKEDLNKFIGALNEAVEHVKKELLPDYDFDQFEHSNNEESSPRNTVKKYTDSSATFG